MILNEDLPNMPDWQKKIIAAPGDKRADLIQSYIESRFSKNYADVKSISPILTEYVQDNEDKISDYDNPIFIWLDNYIENNPGIGATPKSIPGQVLDAIHTALEDDIINYNDVQDKSKPFFNPSLFKNNPDPDNVILWLKTFKWLPKQKNYIDALSKDGLTVDDVFYDKDKKVKSIDEIKQQLQQYKDKIVKTGTEVKNGMETEYTDDDLSKLSDDDVIKKADSMDQKSLIKLVKMQANNIKTLKASKK